MNKKLIAGLFLLNLASVSLDSFSSETSISDAEVLKQLVELREFIDDKRDFTKQSSKDLKPVLIKYRAGTSKFDGVVQGNLSFNTDALHLSIGANAIQKDGSVLNIIINVVYEWTAYVGYTIKSAKLLATKNVVIVGDIDVTGDVDVAGDIDAEKITGDEIVEKMSGYNASVGTTTNFTIEKVYIGACKNGNKLTLVVAMNVTKTDTGNDFDLATITIPSSVGAKLYPTQLGDQPYLSFLDFKKIQMVDEDLSIISQDGYVYKNSNTSLAFSIKNSDNMTTNKKYYVRYEVTFLLSDDIAE